MAAPDGRGVGFYFRNTTEMILFGVCGQQRTLASGRTQVISSKHGSVSISASRMNSMGLLKPAQSRPFLELFARGQRADLGSMGQ